MLQLNNAKCEKCEAIQEKLRQTEHELKQLKERVLLASSLVEATQAASDSEMTGGNVPQRRYEYLKGQNELALEVMAILEVGPRQASKPGVVSLGFGSLFKGVLK